MQLAELRKMLDEDSQDRVYERMTIEIDTRFLSGRLETNRNLHMLDELVLKSVRPPFTQFTEVGVLCVEFKDNRLMSHLPGSQRIRIYFDANRQDFKLHAEGGYFRRGNTDFVISNSLQYTINNHYDTMTDAVMDGIKHALWGFGRCAKQMGIDLGSDDSGATYTLFSGAVVGVAIGRSSFNEAVIGRSSFNEAVVMEARNLVRIPARQIGRTQYTIGGA